MGGGQGQRGLAPGGEEAKVGPGGKTMVKLPGGNTLTPMLPWLWDSMQGSWPL